MDIEGSEFNTLLGSGKFLSSPNIDFLVEVNILTCGNHGYSATKIFEIFKKNGFVGYRVAGERVLWELNDNYFQEIVYADYFFTKRSSIQLEKYFGFKIVGVPLQEVRENILNQGRYGAPHWIYNLVFRNRVEKLLPDDLEVKHYLDNLRLVGHEELAQTLLKGYEIAPS